MGDNTMTLPLTGVAIPQARLARLLEEVPRRQAMGGRWADGPAEGPLTLIGYVDVCRYVADTMARACVDAVLNDDPYTPAVDYARAAAGLLEESRAAVEIL